MSKFCRFWLQLSLIYNAIIAVESLFSQAWMMLGIAAISLWCLTLLMSKRYGFIYVDADDFGQGTYRRYKKDSFDWYKKVIASNGRDLD